LRRRPEFGKQRTHGWMDEMRAHPRQPTGHTTAFLALRKKRKRQKKTEKPCMLHMQVGPAS